MKALRHVLLVLLLLLAHGAARADACTASMSNVDFGTVSPIRATDVTASGTGSVSCTWSLLSALPPYVLLFPNVQVCVHIGVGSNSLQANPRTLGAGSGRMEYNLYRDATYAASAIAGGAGIAGAPTPISLTMSAPNLLTGGTLVAPFTVYGKIPAGASLRAVATTGNANTVYSSSFAGAARISYAFYNLFAPGCNGGSTSSVAFDVQATAVNDCTISAAPLQFGSGGVPGAVVRSSSGLSVRCVKNNAYQVALSGGTVAGNVAQRKMRHTNGVNTVDYELSASLDGIIWGDGTGGSSVHSGVGTGESEIIPVFGRVPAQTGPAPGDYADTVTATIYF